MSKEFETPDFIENVESSDGSKKVHQIDEEIDAPFHFTLNHALTIIVLYAGYLADQFTADMVHSTYSTIDAEIGPAPNNFFWALTIPTVVGGVLAPIAGRAGDMFGRKNIQLAASIFGIIASAISVKTDSMRVFMVASCFSGISYAGHQLALASIVEIYPRKWRAMIIGLFMGAKLPADGFGPLIGAGLIMHSSWRGIFWLTLALYIFSFIGTFLFYHPEKLPIQRSDSLSRRVMHFDYIGTFLLCSSISVTAVGLIFGGTVFKWISVGVFVPTFIGSALIPLLIGWVIFNKVRYPLVPKALGLPYWSMWGTIFLIGMVCSTTNGMWPTQAQILYATSTLSLGLFEMSYGLAGSLFAPIAGWLFFPKYARWILIVYATILFIAVGAEAVVDKDTAAGSTVITVFNGAMHGATIVVTTAMVQLTVNHEDLGVATNLIFSSFTFGGVAYGIIDNVLVTNKIKEWAIKLDVPALFKAGIPLTSLLEAVPAFLAGKVDNPIFAAADPAGLAAAGEALKEVYVHTLRYVYEISILFGGIMVIFACLQRNIYSPITSRVDHRLRLVSAKSLMSRKSDGF